MTAGGPVRRYVHWWPSFPVLFEEFLRTRPPVARGRRERRGPGEAGITADYDKGVPSVRAPPGTAGKQPHTVEITGGT